jgi:hypothetical protein
MSSIWPAGVDEQRLARRGEPDLAALAIKEFDA